MIMHYTHIWPYDHVLYPYGRMTMCYTQDVEQTPLIWAGCADVSIVAAPAPVGPCDPCNGANDHALYPYMVI